MSIQLITSVFYLPLAVCFAFTSRYLFYIYLILIFKKDRTVSSCPKFP